jgi:hypothetical protein
VGTPVRPYKVHYVASHRTYCNTPLQYNASPDRTTPYQGEVTCLICMYHLGLYVPLVKLKEHQFMQRLMTNPAGLFRAYTLYGARL